MAELITLSCGIGRSFEEAAKAIMEAKKNKLNNLNNIQIYNGLRLRSKLHEGLKQKVQEYHKLSRVLSEEYKKLLEEFALRDPVTGLLNKTGFVLNLEKLKQEGIVEGYYLLFDLDDLHDWNNKIGYTKVDEYIEMIGKVIHSNIRHENMTSSGQQRTADVIAHRLNESAGDEFLIFVPCNPNEDNMNNARKIAERILQRIYEKEKEIK